MKLLGTLTVASLLLSSINASPTHVHKLEKRVKKTTTSISYIDEIVTTTFTKPEPEVITTVINTSIKKKGKYTFPPQIVINVKNAPTKLRITTTYTTSVNSVITSTYHTHVPATPTSSVNCKGVEGSTSESYWKYQIGDYYQSIPDPKSCSQKCALFADCVAFEWQDPKDGDPDYPQNCFLYSVLPDSYLTKDSTTLVYYHQSCFATVQVPKTPTYPKNKVCGITGANTSQYSRTQTGQKFSGSVADCAAFCLSQSNCAVYEYSEIEFMDGDNCHTYSGALDASYDKYRGAPVTPVGTTNEYRWIYERGCASASTL